MVEPLAGGQEESESAMPSATAPSPGDPASARQLAEQVAERVYRLMLVEARLSRARGQRVTRREQVSR